METMYLPERIKELSEMYALGSINLTQVAEEIEKYSLSVQSMLMSKAMIHAERYYSEYEKWQNAKRLAKESDS